MTLLGELRETDWSVAIEATAIESGGYRCRIHVTHKSPDGMCEREFTQNTIYGTECEAALEGLRAGMKWIEMKKSNTFTV
ncbi:hypothetical protein [Burkholderia stagnalis]|uniref:hypothetical protein n=1 Tax=Burkholderia stagnalis TaxID=1503054 RepID=UPI000F7FC9B2|nr:hypothetical protein [Burkholderia stagnalis]